MKIILSIDGNKDYRDMIPLALAGWARFFPEAEVVLVDVSDKRYPGVPSANIAKVARLFTAAQQGDAVCMINDIDEIPLQREHYANCLKQRKAGELLCIGGKMYEGTKDAGKFPIGYTTAEGHVFKSIVNPAGLPWGRWIEHLLTIKGTKENLRSPFTVFSDESLMRHFLTTWKGKRCNVPLWSDSKKDVIHRFAPIDTDKLNGGGYISAHHLIPAKKCLDKINVIKRYLGCE